MNWLYIFIGGGLGSLCRYLIGRWGNQFWSLMPLGTFLANIFGSLLIGFFAYFLLARQSSHLHALLIVGFCGGFTTFSSFAFENMEMIRQGNYAGFIIYTIASLAIAIIAVFLGMGLFKLIFPKFT